MRATIKENVALKAQLRMVHVSLFFCVVFSLANYETYIFNSHIF